MADYYSPSGELIELAEWVRLLGGDSTVAYTKLQFKGRGIDVSTVYLGVNHRFGDGEPLIYETMVLGLSEHGEMQERYSTYQQAFSGHHDVTAAMLGMGASIIVHRRGETMMEATR